MTEAWNIGTRVVLSQVASLLLLDSRILAEAELVLFFLHLNVNRKLFEFGESSATLLLAEDEFVVLVDHIVNATQGLTCIISANYLLW